MKAKLIVSAFALISFFPSQALASWWSPFDVITGICECVGEVVTGTAELTASGLTFTGVGVVEACSWGHADTSGAQDLARALGAEGIEDLCGSVGFDVDLDADNAYEDKPAPAPAPSGKK